MISSQPSNARAGFDVLDELRDFGLKMIRAAEAGRVDQQDEDAVAFFGIGHGLATSAG